MKLTKDTLRLKGPHPFEKKNQYKKSLRLSQVQRNIIVGTLLGDAHLEQREKLDIPIDPRDPVPLQPTSALSFLFQN